MDWNKLLDILAVLSLVALMLLAVVFATRRGASPVRSSPPYYEAPMSSGFILDE